MTNDAKAILLLAGRFGNKANGCQPLGLSNYNRLVRWLVENELRPADLLKLPTTNEAAVAAGVDEARFSSLLGRGVQLGFAIEEWNRSGLWVVCRSDEDYPGRYLKRLRENAPPILFGAGDKQLLSGGGLAIVGSRNVDEVGTQFTRDVAAWCATGKAPVVSGGARGVDKTAMNGALEAGGTVVGVLAENLLRASVARDSRDAIADSRLLLISHCHPNARFNVGTAMWRNKLIYAMADAGLVVSAEYKKGGTWAGAEEELKRKPAKPVFVRRGKDVPSGNTKLVKLGGVQFPQNFADLDPSSIGDLISTAKNMVEESQFPLFSEAGSEKKTAISKGSQNGVASTLPDMRLEGSDNGRLTESGGAKSTAYDVILELLINYLSEPKSVDDLTKQLDVKKSQMQDWLRRAISENKVKKLSRPIRYEAVATDTAKPRKTHLGNENRDKSNK